MDTKWNNTEQPALPGDVLREAKPKAKRPPGRFRAFLSFLSFFLGVTLVLASAGSMGAQVVWERDLHPRFTSNWQETDEFRQEVCQAAKDFLTVGAGGKLNFYSGDYWLDEGENVLYAYAEPETVYDNVFLWDWGKNNEATVIEEALPDLGMKPVLPADPGSDSPDDKPVTVNPLGTRYESDKNLLYFIRSKDGKTYDNCGGDLQKLKNQTLEGFNFYLTFEKGKAAIVWDGKPVDIYGDGLYRGDSQWFLPGYENFPATEQLDGVSVQLAVRQTPSSYYAVDYQTGQSYSSSPMYYLFQRVQQIREFYQVQAAVLASGVLCLFVWFCLRKSRELADRKIASWTLHVWTEARFFAVLFCVVPVFFSGERVPDVWWTIRYEAIEGRMFSSFVSSVLQLLLNNVPMLILLVWVLWLIHNDHRCNPKEVRRSLLRPFFRGLRAKDLERPIQKRLARNQAVGMFAMLVLAFAELYNLFLILYHMFEYSGIHITGWMIYIQFPLLLLGLPLLYGIPSTWRNRDLAKDIGALADQVEAVRAGDLSTPLDLPEDTDLRKTADSLNDIQAGMKAALEEQTRSERMKVELVSNVSHDIKTPLTSILSYAELLRQEDLPPVAADYARIIDEKAHRLKGMVEDVFEISKAAADQLPVHPERLDLCKLLRQTMADLEEPIRASSLAFKLDLPAEPVMIIADGKRLYRVFQNLIDNALRYALEGSRVYLSLQTAGGIAQVSVRNTSRNELPDGVDFTARFVRGDASRTDGGSGLGLSIASSFTQACGGSFRVETLADLFTAIVTFPLD